MADIPSSSEKSIRSARAADSRAEYMEGPLWAQHGSSILEREGEGEREREREMKRDEER